MDGITFKDIFPTWEVFREFLLKYSVYYKIDEYTDERILIYYSILYRQYANSRIALDPEIFLERLSLLIAENFREFFLIRKVLDFAASSDISEMVQGLETITNIADKPNIIADKNEVVNYIGAQTRSRMKENIVDRVNSLAKNLVVREITKEIDKYKGLFWKIIPRYAWQYEDI